MQFDATMKTKTMAPYTTMAKLFNGERSTVTFKLVPKTCMTQIIGCKLVAKLCCFSLQVFITMQTSCFHILPAEQHIKL